MNKVGIFFGSNGGTTEGVASQIASMLNVDSSDVHNVANASAEDLMKYDVILLGTSTWGSGDLQDDWFDFLPKIAALDLKGKYVGLFGCGDSVSFGDTFCDGMGTIYADMQGTGATFVGKVPTDGYSFDSSVSVVDGVFVGCALDEMNEDGMTGDRISAWVDTLKKDIPNM